MVWFLFFLDRGRLFFFLREKEGTGGGNRFNKGGLGRVGTSYMGLGGSAGTCGQVPQCINASTC